MALAAAEADPLQDLLRPLMGDPRLVHVELAQARQARWAGLDHPLPPELWSGTGSSRLWEHQAVAVRHLLEGTSVVIATGTSSGKSLCYQAAIGATAAQGATTLLLLPTKALAQDQLRALGTKGLPGVRPATYDGDSSPEHRRWVRANANVVLTNPEMLHTGLLPHHDRWAGFLARLRFVVVDELHLLRGMFGSHFAHLLRRLRRTCESAGSDPTFAFTTATLGSPGELATALCGKPVVEVLEDGSPAGPKAFVLWNPEGADGELAERALSTTSEAARVTAMLVADGRRTITFCRSRKAAELVAAEIGRRVGPALASKVRAYRGGYLPEERREVERLLFSGELSCVVATTALEVGIDVGGLDACVLAGFPGTISSMRQQAGRAGRGTTPSLTVLVRGDDQLDQWLMSHPTEVFTRPPEPAVVNPSNPYVELPHVACAAYEQPLSRRDDRWWPALDEAVRSLVLDDQLRLRRRTPEEGGPLAFWAARGWPASRIGLRGSGDEVRIEKRSGRSVGTVPASRAFRQVHPGAVYLHQGEAYRVVELDLDDLVAVVEADDGTTYTQPRSEAGIEVLDEDANARVGAASVGLGPVRVRSRVVGYRRYDVVTRSLLESQDLDLPPTELETRAFWYCVPVEVLDRVGVPVQFAGGALHAVEHAAIGILPLFAICDRWDVGGVSTPLLPETGLPTIVIYDGYPGGAGVAELGFERAREHLAATLEVISSCRCSDGCPSCVQSPKCGNGNEPLDKEAAIAVLAGIMGSAVPAPTPWKPWRSA